jgi:hypothetical protein
MNDNREYLGAFFSAKRTGSFAKSFETFTSFVQAQKDTAAAPSASQNQFTSNFNKPTE